RPQKGGNAGGRNCDMGKYAETYARWRKDPMGFWADAAKAIDWDKPATAVFDPKAGIYGRWFVGASCTTCFNALDRHVAKGRGDQVAVIYDSPVTGVKKTITYRALLDEVA